MPHGTPTRARRLPVALAAGLLLASATPAVAGDGLLIRTEPGVRVTDARLAAALGGGEVTDLPAGWRAVDPRGRVDVAEAVGRLAPLPGAVEVEADALLRAEVLPDDPLLGPVSGGYQWGLRNTGHWAGGVAGADIDAAAGWDAAAAAGEVIVAVADEGVQFDHPDLAARMWTNTAEIPGNAIDDDGDGFVDDVQGWDFLNEDRTVYDSVADDHGTHVAGTIGAAWGNGVGVAGVAPAARIMPLKFLGSAGGSSSDAVEAIAYAVDHGARVINMSFGSDTYSDALCDAIAYAAGEGVVVVAAAGNNGRDTDLAPHWPSSCPEPSMITVAATDDADLLAGFSNRGAVSVDVGAPGDAIVSTLPGGYGFRSGTSMATPHVAGIAAVLIGLRPGAEPWQVAAAIRDGGDPVPALSGTTATGRRVSLSGAVAALTDVRADLTPPGAAPLLAPAADATVTEGRPLMSWGAAVDAESGIERYELLVDDVVVTTVAGTLTSARPSADLAPGAHRWTVAAIDRGGNRTLSPARTLTVLAPEPPPAEQVAAPLARRRATVGLVVAPRLRAGARAVLRIRSDRAGTATVRILRGRRVVGTFTVRVRAGSTRATVPARLARGLRAGRHVVQVTLEGATSREVVRVTGRGG